MGTTAKRAQYYIPATEVTEAIGDWKKKAQAVENADALAEQHPGVTFEVKTTTTDTTVYTVEAPAPAPAVEVEATEEDAAEGVHEDDAEAADSKEEFDALLAETIAGDAAEDAGTDEDDAEEAEDADADTDDQEDAEEAEDADAEEAEDADADADTDDEDDAEEADQQDAGKAGAVATAELCAANTNAKRMHYRLIGAATDKGHESLCGSASTTRKANAHQIETASMCVACEKLIGDRVVDRSPAGSGGGKSKGPKTLIFDAGEIRDLVAHLHRGEPYAMRLTDGTLIQCVAGDPVSGELGEQVADTLAVTLTSS